jgi:Tol biopolymer transport system component
LKKQQIALFGLLALAVSITVGCGGGGTPTFTQMAFYSGRSSGDATTPLYLMKLDGSGVTGVPYTLNNFYSPSISADAKTIVFAASPNIYSMKADGTGQTQLTTNTDDPADSYSSAYYARISPDGKKILYTFYDGANEYSGIWIMNVDGTGKTNLTPTLPTDMQDCYSSSFSADSRKVTFSCYGNSGGAVYTANVDGSNQKTVVPATTNAYLDTPMFSRDGKKVLFTGYNYGVNPTVRSNAASSFKPTLAFGRPGVHNHVAPRIPSNQGIFSINADGTGTAVMVVPGAYEGEVLNSNLYYTLYDSDLNMSQIWKSNLDGTSAVKLSDGTSYDALYVSED